MNNYAVDSYVDTYRIYELKEEATGSLIRVCPERGGIVIGCRLHGLELFYLDQATFEHPSANIRGGNPVLFPICGQLADTSYEWNGRTYRMANHGVARTSPWEVAGTSTDGEASITLRLTSNESTLLSYPFPFELLFTYALKDGQLHIRQQYANTGTEAMPFYAGFHPYFSIDGSKSIAYESDATKLLDYNDNEVKPFTGVVDLEELVESVCLLDAAQREIAFPVAGGARVKLSYDDVFKYVVLWSVKDRPFVCVEPWMAMTGELNRQEELYMLEPGTKLDATLTIGWEAVTNAAGV
mgnify:CR=1 FL=1|jgi:Galactose mutarotase and related enzymes